MPFNFNPNTRRVSMSLHEAACHIWLARVLVGIMFFGMLVHPVKVTSAPVSTSYSFAFSWDSSPSPDVAGYRVYYGSTSGNYMHAVMSSGATTATISGLSYGVTYYFAVTAVSADGTESDFSDEYIFRRELPVAQLVIQSLPSGGNKLTVTGFGGHSYDIQSTVDFQTWTLIGTVTMGADGSVDFTDPNTAPSTFRFYRIQETQSVEPAFARARVQIQAGAGQPLKLTVAGLAGHTYGIEATEDFIVWTVIGTVTPATDGPMDFIDPNAGNFSQRFYRTRENP